MKSGIFKGRQRGGSMYQFEGRIRYSECDAQGKCTLLSILEYFQDCAIFHSQDHHVGLDYLAKNHCAWFLISWQIVVDKYPEFGSEIVVKTLPYDLKGFLGFRNFVMETKQGEQLAYANSVWSMMDTQTNMPMRPTQEMLKAYTIEPRLQMEYLPRKIALPQELLEQDPIEVMEYHLDTNQHVNNSEYTKIAMHFVPKDKPIRMLRAEYKKQAKLGDMIYPAVDRKEQTVCVALQNEQKEEYAIVEFYL